VVNTTIDHQEPAVPSAARAILYVGDEPRLIEASLASLHNAIALDCEPGVMPALLIASRSQPDVVIVDLIRQDDARVLLIAALAAARHPPRVVVLARADDVSRCLRYPGVRSVITMPLFPAQLRAAVRER
jgi:DNA-binding NarL/FixJ family response regulator